jgi:hypothetical protein
MSEPSLIDQMQERENYGLLAPKINGYDPEKSKIDKAYQRALFSSNFGVGLMWGSLVVFLGLTWYFDLLKNLEQTSFSVFGRFSDTFWLFVCAALIVTSVHFLKSFAGIGQKCSKLSHGLFRIESAEYEKQKHQYTRQ